MRSSVFEFKADIWRSPGQGGWYFATMPKTQAKKIRQFFADSEEGWGRLKSKVSIDTYNWQTAIWYDTKASSYLLPFKAAVRKKIGLTDGSSVKVRVEILD